MEVQDHEWRIELAIRCPVCGTAMTYYHTSFLDREPAFHMELSRLYAPDDVTRLVECHGPCPRCGPN